MVTYMKLPPPLYSNGENNVLVKLKWLFESRLFKFNFISNL